MIKTIAITPPDISFYFNTDLLLEAWERIINRVLTKIIPLSKRKIRSQDTGKIREFDLLLKEFELVHERKKIEKADYEAKKDEAFKKRPRFPTTSGIIKFRRYVSEE